MLSLTHIKDKHVREVIGMLINQVEEFFPWYVQISSDYDVHCKYLTTLLSK